MRLRTLPVSIAGVFTAAGYALLGPGLDLAPVALCLLFAVLCQIASNFANEYYDFRAGLDRPGRVGPRRGVTEGDITPGAMARATFATLGAACLVGLSLIYWGGWWLVFVGLFIAVGVLAYSSGPYPLSRHGLGEVAVVFFFGVVPVLFTYYLSGGSLGDTKVILGSFALGLMGANVLIVNNYRDILDDREVGKRTLAVILGRERISDLYLINGFLAVLLLLPTYHAAAPWAWIAPAVYIAAHVALYFALCRRSGPALNPLLGMTAMNMLLYSLLFLASALLLSDF